MMAKLLARSTKTLKADRPEAVGVHFPPHLLVCDDLTQSASISSRGDRRQITAETEMQMYSMRTYCGMITGSPPGLASFPRRPWAMSADVLGCRTSEEKGRYGHRGAEECC